MKIRTIHKKIKKTQEYIVLRKLRKVGCYDYYMAYMGRGINLTSNIIQRGDYIYELGKWVCKVGTKKQIEFK